MPQAIPCSAGKGETAPAARAGHCVGLLHLASNCPFSDMFCSQPYSSLLVRIYCCTIPACLDKGRKQRTLQGWCYRAAQGPVSHPVCGDGTNTPPIFPEALPHSDIPAAAASRTQGCRGDGDFPWQGKEQEPINLSAGHTSGTLQEYFVPLAIFIKKSPFPGTVWWMLVSVQGPSELTAGSSAACAGTSALQ